MKLDLLLRVWATVSLCHTAKMLLLRKLLFSLLNQTRVLTTRAFRWTTNWPLLYDCCSRRCQWYSLGCLGRIVTIFDEDGFADKLRQVTSADQVIELFDQASEKAQEPVKLLQMNLVTLSIAVTACNGIAHTYMAQEALQKWLQKWCWYGWETNGASGVGNKLTAEDIRKYKAVIIAADKADWDGSFRWQTIVKSSSCRWYS